MDYGDGATSADLVQTSNVAKKCQKKIEIQLQFIKMYSI